MMWQDLLLEREVSGPRLQAAIANALATRAELVSIVSSIENDTSHSPIVAEVGEAHGEFRTRLSLYLRDCPVPPTYETVSKLASLLDMRILISDETPNPYTMILFEADNAPRKVALDVDSLDQREEYRIAAE